MVLQIRADTRQCVRHSNAVPLQRGGRADAGEHQQLRRVHRAGAQHHFTRCSQFLLSPAWLIKVPQGNAGSTATPHINAFDQGVGEDVQIGPSQHRVQERARTAQTHTIALVQIEDAEAVLALAIEVLIARMARFDRCRNEPVRQRVAAGGALHI